MLRAPPLVQEQPLRAKARPEIGLTAKQITDPPRTTETCSPASLALPPTSSMVKWSQ